MLAKHEEVVVRLTVQQAGRLRRMGQKLWPEENLSVGEVSRRLLLEHLLWAEGERDLVGEEVIGA